MGNYRNATRTEPGATWSEGLAPSLVVVARGQGEADVCTYVFHWFAEERFLDLVIDEDFRQRDPVRASAQGRGLESLEIGVG